MKKILFSVFACLALLAAVPSHAQVAQGSADIQWINPTTNEFGNPLTGVESLTEVQLFIDSASIPDNSTMAPSVRVMASGGVVPQNYVFVASSGTQIFVRAKACNVNGCSRTFSAEASGTIPFPPAVPGVPTSVTITIQLP